MYHGFIKTVKDTTFRNTHHPVPIQSSSPVNGQVGLADSVNLFLGYDGLQNFGVVASTVRGALVQDTTPSSTSF
jgi:hypothetical protein